MDLPDKVSRKLSNLPDGPGCYLMRDRRGRIIYVGKAASLRKRVRSYFRQATLRSADPKLRGLIRSVYDLDTIVVRNEAEALLTEGRLIKEYKPRYNVSFKDDKRFLLLRADPSAPFPRLRLCRIRRDDRAVYFGPYASAAAARAALDFVEKRYGLRKCAPRVPDAETYRHCLNDIIRYCAAPCTGKTTPAAYGERFQEACAFLKGERPAVLRELRQEMDRLAAATQFERAAALRDTLFLLEAAVRQRARVAPDPAMARKEAARGVAELRRVLGLPRRPSVIEGFDISTISGTHSVAGMVVAVEGVPRRSRYRRFRIRSVAGVDDPAMLAEVVRRRLRRLAEEGGTLPDLLLVDGGATQLAAVREVLAEAGFPELPSAGLAKRFEEIYSDTSGVPLRLGRDSAALKVLQRLRDEAHRFALTYHRGLRARRIRESVLDEIVGIGARRKEQLLARFGSVRNLARAGADEVAALPGISRRMADAILAEIRGRLKTGETT